MEEPSSPHPAVTTEAQIAAIVLQMTVLTDEVKSLQWQPTQLPHSPVEQSAAHPMPSRSFRPMPDLGHGPEGKVEERSGPC